jgi:hypothetical protein
MLNLELVITCMPAPGAAQAPHIRAWVDPQPERGLESEFELCMEPVSDSVRRGELKLEQAGSYLFYRVGIVADPSTVWQLVIRDIKSGRVLHEDSDLLALPKGYLIGSCPLRASSAVAVRGARLLTVSRVRALEPANRARAQRVQAIAP